MLKLIRRHLVAIIGILLILGLYLPYLQRGNFVIDDWAVVSTGSDHPGFTASYEALFPQYGNRPLAPVVYALATNLLPPQPAPYIFVNLLFWLCGIGLIAQCLYRLSNRFIALFFFFIALVPVVSSTVLFSPALMLIASISVLLWATSLWALLKFLKTGKHRWLLLQFLLLLVCLLTYEITLPLFTFNVLVPLLFIKTPINKSYIKTHVLPILGVLVLILIYQKLIAPHLAPDISRLRFRGAGVILATSSKFLFLAATDLPLLLLRALQRIGSVPLHLLLIVAGACAMLAREARNAPAVSDKGYQKKFLLIAGVATLSTVALYILAGTIPTIFGYDNRGLIGGTLAGSILLALGTYSAYHYRRVVFYGLLVCVFLYSLAWVIHRDQYILSAQTQVNILADLKQKVEKAELQAGDFVLVNTPAHLPSNFNNEPIFSDEKDTKIAIGPTQMGAPFTQHRLATGRAIINGNKVRSDDLEGEIARAWYYQDGVLRKIKDTTDLTQVITSIKAEPAVIPAPPNVWLDAVRALKDKLHLQSQYEQYKNRWPFN